MIVRIGTLLALAVALAGCNLLETTESELSFSYRPFGGDDEMDQVLEIVNDGPGAVVPTLEITPLDSASQPIPGLKVTTAYGSERGERVLPPYFADIDVLKFEGERAGEVRDVRVEVSKLEQVDYPAIDRDITVERYDDGKRLEDMSHTFDAIELRNPNDDDVPVKVALIAWGPEEDGNPQQAEWVIPLDDEPVTVPGKGRKIDPDAAGPRRQPDRQRQGVRGPLRAHIRNTP